MTTTITNFFNDQDLEDIDFAIKNAEQDSSGELRLHVESICIGDVNKRAKEVFAELDINQTKLRNGVLLYLAIKSRKFAIVDDIGIKDVVPLYFWEEINQVMLNNIRDGQIVLGLTKSIALIGELLKKYFPHQQFDENELPDEISFGD